MICRQLVIASFMLSLTVITSNLDAQVQEQRNVETFNHAGPTSTELYHVGLRHGEVFTVVVENTATNCFSYDVEAVTRDPGTSDKSSVGIGENKRTIRIVHEKQYGGYIVHIRRIRNLPVPEKCMTQTNIAGSDVVVTDLPDDVTIIVIVETAGFEVALAGGFTFSDLTNHVFASRPNAAGHKIVDRDISSEDDVDLGLGAFNPCVRPLVAPNNAYNNIWNRRRRLGPDNVLPRPFLATRQRYLHRWWSDFRTDGSTPLGGASWRFYHRCQHTQQPQIANRVRLLLWHHLHVFGRQRCT